MWFRFLAFPLALRAGLAVAAVLAVALVVALACPNLPSLQALTEYQPKIPLRIYSAEGVLIGEFGEERRSVVSIEEVPDALKHAILAAEDERFYEHPGIDYVGVLRAAYANLVAGGRRQGASTITMQVARNFFLSSEKTATRKLYEVLLAFKIEHSLTKDQILELYVNQIYLGQRAYGFAAAAQIYFGKSLEQLSLAETAMLAGLPKAPSMYNPVANLQRSRQRQHYVLRRMSELGHITAAQYEDAVKAPLRPRREANEYAIHGEYAAEMVRQAMAERYPDEVYARGFRVYTTLRKVDQEAAYVALRRGALEQDRRGGYRRPEGYAELPASPGDDDFDEALADHPDNDELLAAVVLAADAKQVQAALRSGEKIAISGEGLRFAARALDAKTPPQRRIRRGAIIRVQAEAGGKSWQIVQLPEVESAFISLDAQDGAVRALVGGFDFSRNKFNHVTQAWRQPGSSFKPFIYSASLEKGFTPATVIADEPVVLEAEQTGSQRWEPKNYDGKFEGPMRMRTALAKSKNMASMRVLDPRNAFIMDNMMQDVMRYGTGARAARLARVDLAGKTGTTNEFVDAWFAGYQPTLVAIAWVGFDQPKTLGRNQTGGIVALPIWLGYMEKVLKDIPEMPRSTPPGVVTVPVMTMPGENPGPAPGGAPKLVPEYFYQEAVPPPEVLQPPAPIEPPKLFEPPSPKDRKSTRLNSSHSQISYAVFCLKKKKIHTINNYS